MIRIDLDTANSFLTEDTYRYLLFYLSINSMPPSTQMELFADNDPANVIACILNTSPGSAQVTFTGFDPRFTGECLAYIQERYANIKICAYDKFVITAAQTSTDSLYSPPKRISSLVCTSAGDLESSSTGVSILTEADIEAIRRYPKEPCSQHVLEEYLSTHRVYGIRDNGEILAYLAVLPKPEYKTICNSEFCHVREDWRGRGFSMSLAAQYAMDTLQNGCIPYYGWVVNPFAERGAVRAGFRLCSELYMICHLGTISNHRIRQRVVEQHSIS